MEPSSTSSGTVYLKCLANDNQKEKNLLTGLLDHCIFCLRKTGDGKRRGGPDGNDRVVPRAIIRPQFIQSFNEVWQHLRSVKRIAVKTNLVAPAIPRFDNVPTICQSCANLTQYVAELLENLKLRVGQLKGVITEAREKGGGGRWEHFERSLRESTEFGRKDDEFILKFVETLDSNSVDDNTQVNQPSKNWKAPLKRKHNHSAEDQGHRVELGTPSINLEETSTSSSVNETSENVIKIENEKGDVVMEFLPEPEDTQETGNDSDSDYNPLDDATQDDTSASDLEEEETKSSNSNNCNSSASAAQNQEEISNDDSVALATSTTTTFQDIFICEIKNCGKMCIGKDGYLNHKSIWHSDKNLKLKLTCSTPTCGKKFRTRTLLKEHMKKNLETHPEYHIQFSKLRYPCDLCGDPLTLSQEHSMEHLKTHLGGDAEYIVKCPIEKCPYLFTNHTAAAYHLTSKHYKTDNISEIRKAFGLTCETCGHVSATRSGLRGHVTRSHERGEDSDKLFKCPVENCSERFFVKQSVDFHLEKHRVLNDCVTKQRCELCKEEIKVEEMEDHLTNEHQIITEILRCDQCPCVFSSGKGLLEHLYEHRKSKCLYCFICKDGVKFGRHCDLRWHFEKEHQIECTMQSCDLCEKKCFLKSDLAGHKLRDHGNREKIEVKKWKCDECPVEKDVRFLVEDGLISHKITCHGAVPFKCEQCEETFSSLVGFNRHKKGHLGILPMKKEWKCGEEGCGKVYPSRGTLRIHKERSHGGERKWICEVCGRAFFDRGSLRSHNDSVHLGLKPWVCEECGERFGDSGVLRTHMLIHTGERKYCCKICGQRFRHSGVLKKHLEGHETKGDRFKPNGPMKNIRKRKAQAQ